MRYRAKSLAHSVLIVSVLTANSFPFHQSFGQSVLTYNPAQLACRIDQISLQDRKLNVNCTAPSSPANKLTLHFTDQFAGVNRLSERIFALRVREGRELSLPLEIRGNGLYSINVAERANPITISYEIRLARALEPSQYALTSSLGPEAGVLLLADLLPRLCVDETGNCEANLSKVQIIAPDGWSIGTNEKLRNGFFEISDPAQAVFFLGRLRERVISANEMKIRVAVASSWSFGDEEIFKLADAIAREQALFVGSEETGDFLVTLAPFPIPLTGLRSSAVTIGRTVVLLLNTNNDSAQSFAHYRRHLAHEMFHFYLPNAFRIRENFDWFWEGFTRYFALLTLVRLHIVGLREYLNAIGEEYEAYVFNPARARLSLINASPEKFANPASYDLVYRKGMLVAALYDLDLRWQSKGKHSVADVIRMLYHDYARRDFEIGNREVLSALNKYGDLKRVVVNDIEGTAEIDIAERIKPYGLLVEWSPATRGKVRITGAPKLSRRQRELFDLLTGER